MSNYAPLYLPDGTGQQQQRIITPQRPADSLSASTSNTPGRPVGPTPPPTDLRFPGDVLQAQQNSDGGYLMGAAATGGGSPSSSSSLPIPPPGPALPPSYPAGDSSSTSPSPGSLPPTSIDQIISGAAAARQSSAAAGGLRVQFHEEQLQQLEQEQQRNAAAAADAAVDSGNDSGTQSDRATRKAERRDAFLSDQQRLERGQAVPLIKPRYGPWRRNKESIRVSTNLTLGQQHDTASQVLSSGASRGTRPEKMTVTSGVQSFHDEVHFDAPYAMYQARSGQILTRSVGWSRRGDFVVERSDLVLTSDCYCSDSDGIARMPALARKKTQNNNENNDVGGEDNNNNDGEDEENNNNNRSTTPGRKRLRVASSRFERPVCLDPAAPKPREVVSDGELRAASRNLWRRKYPGVKCPKNRKVRNRLMNDFFVSEHTRPAQLFHASEAKQGRGGVADAADDVNTNNNNQQQYEDDALVRPGQQLSFKVDKLPKEFVDFADMTEKQQQQFLEKREREQQEVMMAAARMNSNAVSSDPNSADARWNRLPPKHRQEITNAVANTGFMPCFIRDIETQVRSFLAQHHEYYDKMQKKKSGGGKKKNAAASAAEADDLLAPCPFFDVLCQDGYGRLVTHCVAQFYLLSSQSHDRCIEEIRAAAAAAAAATSNNSNINNNNDTSSASPPAASSTSSGSPSTPQIIAIGGSDPALAMVGGDVLSNNNSFRRKQKNSGGGGGFQRVTRVAIATGNGRPPAIPEQTILSMFGNKNNALSQPVSPQLPPQQQQQQHQNSGSKKAGGGGKGRSPTTAESPAPLNLGAAAAAGAATQPPRPKRRQPNSVSPTLSPSIAPAPAPPTNRFSSLGGGGGGTRGGNNNNYDDDASSSSSNSDGGYDRVGGSDRPKRFRKRRTILTPGVTRRAILPLLNGN